MLRGTVHGGMEGPQKDGKGLVVENNYDGSHGQVLSEAPFNLAPRNVEFVMFKNRGVLFLKVTMGLVCP